MKSAWTLHHFAAVLVFGVTALAWGVGCFSNNESNSATDAGKSSSSASIGATVDSSTAPDGTVGSDAGDASTITYTLIDNMQTTSGPIDLDAGFTPPEKPGTWFNFGATADADTATPPINDFAFTSLTTPVPIVNGQTSNRAAYQICTLNALYDVCGFGFNFAQEPIADAGDAGDAGIADAGDGEASVPQTALPFDISRYQGITFWGMAAAGEDDAGGLDIKVLFPDTDTDPRGGVCNSAAAGASGPTDFSQCYNDYAEHVTFTSTWQQFTVLFSAQQNDAGLYGDLAIDGTFGYQDPGPWTGTNVYGISWQAQNNDAADAGPQSLGFWVTGVYFVN